MLFLLVRSFLSLLRKTLFTYELYNVTKILLAIEYSTNIIFTFSEVI